ncbi:MAG: STAS domain-containing protein [Acidimicrobiia bacterium]
MSTQTPLSPESLALPVPFVATSTLDGDVLTITIAGELDIATVDHLGEVQRSVQGRYRTIRYELAALSFIDSAGLRALLAPANHQVPISEMIIANPTQGVHRLLELRDLQGMVVFGQPEFS